MSAQSDPRKAENKSDDWRPNSGKKRSSKRPYVIEWRYTGTANWMRRRYGQWHKWGAYETAKRRDSALQHKQKENTYFEYRAIDRNERRNTP